MTHFFKGFISRVYHLRVEGIINHHTTNQIARGLQTSWPYRPLALFVTINSSQGSITQAKNISDLLLQQSYVYNIPIITFVEDICLGSANLILTTGVKCYANSFSMIGDIGLNWNSLWYNKIGQKYGIRQDQIKSGQSPIDLDKFKELPVQTEKWIKNYLYHKQHELKMAIISNRANHFTEKGIDRQTLQKKVFKGIIDPQEAVKLGLIDGLKSIDDELKYRFPGAKVKQIKRNKDWKQSLTAQSQKLEI